MKRKSVKQKTVGDIVEEEVKILLSAVSNVPGLVKVLRNAFDKGQDSDFDRDGMSEDDIVWTAHDAGIDNLHCVLADAGFVKPEEIPIEYWTRILNGLHREIN